MDSLQKKKQHIPKFFTTNPDGKVVFDVKAGNVAEFRRVTAEGTGAKNVRVVNQLIDQVACTQTNATDNGSEALNVTVALLHELAPQNALEGMLVSQMIGIHNLAMSMMARASSSGQTAEGVEQCVNRAVKLTRTFAAQVEALHKLRNGGQQKVTVEHVTVNAGGQAIVGNVESKKGVGGADGS